MKPTTALPVLTLALAMALPVAATSPREDQLAAYAAAARAANPAFAGFSATRGKTLHTQSFAGGKPESPACTSCHGNDPRGTGRTPAGKVVEAMALSTSPARYTDPAKVEKWFKRNCNDVLGRPCTAQEKGDVLAYLLTVR